MCARTGVRNEFLPLASPIRYGGPCPGTRRSEVAIWNPGRASLHLEDEAGNAPRPVPAQKMYGVDAAPSRIGVRRAVQVPDWWLPSGKVSSL